jgi:hypothetical protein
VITSARTAATTAALRRTTHLLVVGGGSSVSWKFIARHRLHVDWLFGLALQETCWLTCSCTASISAESYSDKLKCAFKLIVKRELFEVNFLKKLMRAPTKGGVGPVLFSDRWRGPRRPLCPRRLLTEAEGCSSLCVIMGDAAPTMTGSLQGRRIALLETRSGLGRSHRLDPCAQPRSPSCGCRRRRSGVFWWRASRQDATADGAMARGRPHKRGGLLQCRPSAGTRKLYGVDWATLRKYRPSTTFSHRQVPKWLWEPTAARQAVETAWISASVRRTFMELLVPAGCRAVEDRRFQIFEPWIVPCRQRYPTSSLLLGAFPVRATRIPHR